MAKYCMYCGSQISETAAFCQSCGKPVQQTVFRCLNCGSTLKSGVRFCENCGHPVNTGQPQQQQHTSARQTFYSAAQTIQNAQAVKAAEEAARQSAPRRKRGCLSRILAILLIVVLIAAVFRFVKPGWFEKKNKEEALINRVQVFIPNPTGPEAVVSLTGDLALHYYIQARLYLEKLSQYDVGKIDEEEFGKLVLDTLTALEDAEKLCDFLGEAVDLWMECSDVRDKPTYKVIQRASRSGAEDPLGMTVYAASSSPSEDKAKQIIEVFDKARNGQKIKAVAEYLGKDTKYAMAALKQALAASEGETYQEIAEKADTCVKVATALKTAGTVAGVVLAAAPLATGAVATMGAGELIATGGSVVVATVNAGLEVTSTGAMLYHGTEDNEVTQMADAISNSQFMQTVNLISGVSSLGYNIKNAYDGLNQIAKNGGTADDVFKFLNTISDGKTPSDMFGIYSFGLSNLDKLPGPQAAVANEALKSLITMITHTGEGGLTIDISDTLIGTDTSQINAVSKLLDELNLKDQSTMDMLNSVVSLYRSGETPKQLPEADPADPIPLDLLDRLLSQYTFISPDGGKANPDEVIELAGTFLEMMTEVEYVPPESGTESASDSSAGTSAGTDDSKSANVSSSAKDGGDKPAGETGWVDPYAYFGVDNIVDLYPHLRKAKPLKIEVTPICYDNNRGTLLDFTNTDTFVIDMTKGAVTTYETSYVDGVLYELSVTFIGDPYSSDLLTINAEYNSYLPENGEFYESGSHEECIIFNLRLDEYREFTHKAIDFDNYTPASIALRIERILLG